MLLPPYPGGESYSSAAYLTSLFLPTHFLTITSCNYLATVTINGNNNVSIGDSAFADCSKLATVTGVPENLKNLDKAFRGTPWLKQKKMNGATELKASQAVTLEPGADAWYWVTVPATDLYDWSTTFDANVELYDADGNRVDAPCVLEKGEKVYVQVTSYEEEKVSGTVSIKAVEYATRGELNTINWSLDPKTETLTVSGTGDMPSYKQPWEEVSYLISKVVVEQGVTSVGASAFSGCRNLESVSLADSVKSVGEDAFSNCRHLATVTASIELPINAVRGTLWVMMQKGIDLEAEDEWTNYSSESGETLYFRFKAPKDGCYRFQVEYTEDSDVGYSLYDSQGDWCTNPLQARKGDTFYVAVYPDKGSKWKQRITEYKASAKSGTFGEGNSFIWSLSDKGELTVNGSGPLSNEDRPWRDFRDEICTITIGEGVTDIEADVFSGYTNVTSVNLPSTLTYIGGYAFYECSSLESVTIPAGVTANSMGEGAFAYCTALATVTWDGATTYEGDAFDNTLWKFRREVGTPPAITTTGSLFQCTEESNSAWFTFTPDKTCFFSSSISGSGSYDCDFERYYENGKRCYSDLLEQGKTYYVKVTVDQPGTYTVSMKARDMATLTLGTPATFAYNEGSDSLHDYSFTANEDGLYQFTFTCKYKDSNDQDYSYLCLWTSDSDSDSSSNNVKKLIKKGQTVYLRADAGESYGTYEVSAVRVNSGKCGKNLKWSVSGGKLTISGKGKMDDFGWDDESYNIPLWTELADQITSIEVGKGVTYIGKYAFGALNKVTNVELPDGLLAIGEGSFNITSMKGITIPGSVKQIAYYAFTWDNVIDDFTITGTPGSAAHMFARDYGYRFVGPDGVEPKPDAGHVHSYGAPTWTWTGNTAATAAFKCKDGDDTQNVKATVTSATTPATTAAAGKTVYTAKVTFQGKTYTDTRTVTIPKLPLKNNTIKVTKSFTKTANAKKSQSFSLGASAHGAALSYSSSNKKKVTVDKNGKVTIVKGFVGKVTITIRSAANATYKAAQIKVTINVIPTVTKFKSVKADKKGKVTMTWNKNATAKKYQIEYAVNKDFTKAAKLNSGKTKATIKKLGKGTWYFRIKAVNGSVSSKWSSTKKLTVK